MIYLTQGSMNSKTKVSVLYMLRDLRGSLAHWTQRDHLPSQQTKLSFINIYKTQVFQIYESILLIVTRKYSILK